MYENKERKEKSKGSRLKRFLSWKTEHGDWKWGRIIAIVVLAILLLSMFFLTMFYSIGVGSCALLVDPASNSISNPIPGPCFGIKMPWQSLVVIYISTDSMGMWGDGTDEYANFPAIACFSRDQLEMNIDVMVRWQLDVSTIRDLYQAYPALNWKDTTIASIIREQMRLTTKGWSAVQTIEHRDVVRDTMGEAISNKLKTEPSLQGAIINFEFELRDIGYPQIYTDAIVAKLAAEQLKMQAEYEASRIITLAQAAADALLINANATAQTKVIDALGIQEAINSLVANANMTDTEFNQFLNLYISLKTLETIAKEQSISFFIGFQDGVPFLFPVQP